ncbi:hypothetical protein MLD38_007173 [Melastoma candidum]|uniref:Uncharacterized protein n=1 Tax=Melastoma candidum TaxID=119954 RepID=A0ACB9RPY7_9MYRT|nr:hypothetical protein MLD38_007173 [Melastoma candidum]
MAALDNGASGDTGRLSLLMGSSSSSSVFHRRIEFHPARKSFNGFICSGGDFKIETLNSGASDRVRMDLGNAVSIMPGKTELDLLDACLDPELSFSVSFQRIGAGLENLGNTCFLNSVLQCLTYTAPLAAYLQSGKHQISCRINGFCALCAIQKHVSRALKATGRIVAPKDLVSNLRCISRNFRNARQEDAHEYMVNLLESMHKCCLPSGVPSESPGAYDKSLVYKIFGGRLRSQVKCMQCSSCSNKFDPFIDLSLEIVKADSIVKALKHFTASELLDGGERQYQCQRCCQKVRALKQLTVHKVPYVLTIHLKRFESHDPGQKINKNVQFDTVLDLKPFVSGSYEGELKYTLYGVLVHHGWSTHSGHYYCYVRTSTNMWYSLDDNQVRQVSESTVLQQKAYMLFYVRNRRNVAPRKFVDNTAKENVRDNVSVNKMSVISAENPRGPGQLGYNLANILSPFAGPTGKDTLKSRLPIKLNSLGASVQERLFAQKELPVRLPMLKDIGNGSGMKQTLQNLPRLDSNVSPNEENALVVMTSSGNSPPSGNSNSSKELLTSSTNIHACTIVPETASNKKIDDETSQQISSSTLAPVVGNSSVSSHVKMHENEGDVEVGDQSGKNIMQVGSIAGECLSDSSPIKEDEIMTKERLTADEKEESTPTLTNEPVEKDALKFRPLKKIKRSSKCHVASLHLSTSILFRVSSGPCRQHRKQKRRKSKRRDRKFVETNGSPSDMEPSSSSETRNPGGHARSSDSKRKRAKPSTCEEVDDLSAKKIINSNHDSFDNIGEPSGSPSENIAAFAACGSLKKNSISSSSKKLNQTAGYEISNDSQRDSMQKGLMSMVTRGLEETLVHWDGIDISPSPSFESNGAENMSIGYVLDEWDEEYDRGKRKKVKHSKHDFTGPNPFQEFASEKIKSKNSKVYNKSYRSPPFRI